MAWSHPGVWSVLGCFIGPTKKENLWTWAQQRLDPSHGLLDTKAPLNYSWSMPVPLSDLTGRLKWLFSSFSLITATPKMMSLGPWRPLPQWEAVLSEGMCPSAEQGADTAGHPSLLSGHHPLGFAPTLTIHVSMVNVLRPFVWLWCWGDSSLLGCCEPAHTALPQPTLLIVFANCFSFLPLINSVPLIHHHTKWHR